MKDKSAIILINLLLTLTSILIFIGVCTISYQKTRFSMLDNEGEKAELNLNLAARIISNQSEKVAVAGFSLASMAFAAEEQEDEDGISVKFILNQNKLDSPKALYNILERFLEANPQLWGAAVGFEPGVYPEYGEAGFAPFVRRAEKGFTRHNLPDEKNNYRNDDWYSETKKQNRFRWSEPFLDVRGAAISCFCIPIHDKSGSFIGTIAVDLELSTFSEILNTGVKPYDKSQLIVLNENLQVMAHPDRSFILRKSVGSIAQWRDSLATQKQFLYTSRIKNAGWTVALICPEEEVLSSTKKLAHSLLVIAIIGILLSMSASIFAYSRIRKFATNQISVNRDIHIASVIQQNMLPHNFPESDRIKLAAILHPAKDVGGDLYDFYLEGNKLVFSIGDVSGKGVPASIVMAVTKAIFRTAAKSGKSMSEVASTINDALSEGNENGMFVTMFLGEIDLETGQLRYCNAGHNPMVIIPPEGSSHFLKPKPNIALGLFSGFTFEEETITVGHGTRLVLYTDGVTEAERSNKEQFGEKRLLEWCDRSRTGIHGGAKNAAEGLLSNVNRFVNGNDQNDDITIMTIKLL